ncbi:mas-related G-protein coupled receptor member H-like [Elgaria multicarinata webbii]|uniref:mas-related G-protein coupled receptor member H-like n=1 Tax=Elgaria multicarinata webbii TaxID=159646 RepID=UPI002FCCDDE2
MADNDYSSSGDLENRSPSSNINGSIGIEHPINTTNEHPINNLSQHLISSFIVIVCLLGLLGNGHVIWLLCFSLKKNPFTTYILNLTIADFGVLISLIAHALFGIIVTLYNGNSVLSLFFPVFLELYFITYSTGQFLPAAISIDRCLAVLFPIWHRYRRPARLSTIVCALVWILSFLLAVIHLSLQRTGDSGNNLLLFQLLLICSLLCTILMVLSTLTLFIIHTCWKSNHQQQGKLVTALLLFLVFAFPMNVLCVIYSYYVPNQSVMLTGFACASLNSSINPLIYFLVGRRQKKGLSKVSMKVALQRVFNDEQNFMEEQNLSIETPL